MALAEALGKGATPQLQMLGLNDNPLGKRGAAALAAALCGSIQSSVLAAVAVRFKSRYYHYR